MSARRPGPVWSENGLVFPLEDGRLMDSDHLSWRTGAVFKGAGLEYEDACVMRHTFASIMDDAGVEHRVIADMMGHRNVTTFQRIYRHRLKPVVTETANFMDDIYGDDQSDGLGDQNAA